MSHPISVSVPSIAPGSVRAWILACRPATLTAAAAPVLVGTALAHHAGAVRPWPGVAALVGAFLLQIGSNFANDVFDFEKGADTCERLGPTRAVQAGLVTPTAMKWGMAVVFGLALLVGLYLQSVAGEAIIYIGIASIAAAIAYTGGPYPLGYHGLGDLFVMLFFGLVAVNGTVYVHLGTVTGLSLWLSVAVGAVATNILVVNNLRDRHTDRVSGKRTLAVRFGRKGAELQYLAQYVIAYALPLLVWALGLSGPGPALALLSLPLSLSNVQALQRTEGQALNALLVRTAKTVFVFGVLLAAGLGLDRGLGH